MKTTTMTRDGSWVMFEAAGAEVLMSNSVEEEKVRMSKGEAKERRARLKKAGWK